jgi:HEAT repeat protein
MIILEDQNSETYFIDVLDFIEQELRLVLANAQFDLAHGLLEKIKQLICDPSGQFSWRNKLIQNFFFKISLDEILEVLETGLLKLKLTDSNQILCFKKVMLMLEAQAVYTLADLLLKLPSQPLQILLMGIIKTLSLQDLNPLERLLNHPNPLLVKKLITILAHLRGKRAKELLLRLMDHRSDDVRQKALFWLIKRGELPVDKVHSLIEDSNSNVRTQVFEQIGREKNSIYERLLRRYIEEKKFRISDRGFLMNCYQALGKCASNESLLFLEKKLFQRITLPLFSLRRSLHRQGAALALIELETQDAKQILNKASRCFYPPIRRAYKRALEFKLGV